MLYLLDLITPNNLHEEEEKFLSSTSYNPVFTYRWQTDPVFKLQLKESPAISTLLKESVLSEDSKAVAEVCKSLFKIDFNADTVALAYSITQSQFDPLTMPDMEKVVEGFKLAIKFFDLDYKIELVDRPGFFFRPSHKKRKIIISKYAQLQFFSVDGVIKHELTHVLRYVNGKHNNIPFNRNYLRTEEGLASFMQDTYGYLGERSMFQHAAEYGASQIGIMGSLRDIYDYFIQIGFTPHLAWQRAARHKFGFTDTSRPGDFLKPATYFAYEQKVKELDKDELWRLFCGKITIADLRKYPDYAGLIPLEKLKQFYLISSFELT